MRVELSLYVQLTIKASPIYPLYLCKPALFYLQVETLESLREVQRYVRMLCLSHLYIMYSLIDKCKNHSTEGMGDI